MFLALVMLGLQGCERRYHLKAHYLDGYLHTPWGKYEFQPIKSSKQASDMKLYASHKTWRGFLYADAGDVIVILPLTGHNTSFLADRQSKYGGKNFDLTIKANETKLLTEDGQYIGQVVSHNLINKKHTTSGFESHGGTGFMRQPGGGIDKPFQIYIPFNMSGDDFLVDVKVKLTKVGYWHIDIGPPGMP
jgi:hypothetical protein